MKGLTLIRRLLISVAVIYWMVATLHWKKDTHFFSTSPLQQLEDLIDWILEPRIERNYISAPETFMTTNEIILSRGYPVEVHSVTTEDGYILELHRIPYGKRNVRDSNSTTQKYGRPVFLQHGLMATDHFWLFNPSNSSLAYMLADHGYDVWLGNSRGNTYSRKHATLDPNKNDEYWNFSWDEMGRYDIPASIDYVLNVTGQSKMAAYFGYSLGSSVFFIAAIEQPRINDKVEVMVGLGPTVSVAHLGNFFKYIAPYVDWYIYLQRLIGSQMVHSNDGLLHRITRLVCERNRFGALLGRHILFQIFGYSESYFEDVIFTLAGHYPAGGSVNSLAHLYQNYNSGERFTYFDYGPKKNLELYGTPHAAEYNLSLVTTPVFLVSADKDDFAPPADVAWLASQLGNLQASIRVDSSSFTHGDFVWSPRLAELIHLPIINNVLPSPHI